VCSLMVGVFLDRRWFGWLGSAPCVDACFLFGCWPSGVCVLLEQCSRLPEVYSILDLLVIYKMLYS
jgi:hypothetical protein